MSLNRYNSISSGELTSYGADPIVTASFRNQMEIKTSYLLARDRPKILNEQGNLEWNLEMLPFEGPWFSWSYSGHRLIQAGATAYFYSGGVYTADFRQVKQGKTSSLSAWMNLKFAPGWQWEWSFEHSNRVANDRSIDFRGNILSSTLRWQASRSLFAYAKFQYDSLEKRYGYDFLLLFEPAPVSRMVLSLKNYCEERFRFFQPQARTLAIKLSYLIRI